MYSEILYQYNNSDEYIKVDSIDELYNVKDKDNVNYIKIFNTKICKLNLINFKNIDDLFIMFNKNLTEIDSLSHLHNLVYLQVSDNALKSLPSLSGLKKIRLLLCNNNKLTSLPPLNDLNTLRVIECKNNLLTEIPNIYNLTELKILRILKNKNLTLPKLNPLVELNYCDY
jgi:internalin A